MPDIKAFYDIALEAARRAGEIQKERFGSKLDVCFKGPKDPVTQIDHLCEGAIVGLILEDYPDHNILAEESPARNTSSPFRWIIDPLDGTTNYSHSYPHFCVSIALERNGEIVLGVVYDPIRDELFSSIKGEGAWMNGRKIHVSETREIERAFVSTGRIARGKFSAEKSFMAFRRIALRVQALRGDGSAVLDLCYVGIGRYDVFWEFGLKPWDLAAGCLIVKEAGGMITDFSGRAFDHYGDEVLASNGKIHGCIMEELG